MRALRTYWCHALTIVFGFVAAIGVALGGNFGRFGHVAWTCNTILWCGIALFYERTYRRLAAAVDASNRDADAIMALYTQRVNEIKRRHGVES